MGKLTLNSDVNFSEIRVHIDLRISLYPIGLTHLRHKTKYSKNYGLNLHFRHLTVLCYHFSVQMHEYYPDCGIGLISRHALRYKHGTYAVHYEIISVKLKIVLFIIVMEDTLMLYFVLRCVILRSCHKTNFAYF
jgi:hypothetical protein